jgi:hypothetical protein
MNPCSSVTQSLLGVSLSMWPKLMNTSFSNPGT